MKVEEYIESEGSTIFHQELLSERREKYNKTYSKEVELNSNFRRFVLNYKAAHEGKNTRRDQVQIQGLLAKRKTTKRKMLSRLLSIIEILNIYSLVSYLFLY